MDQPKSIKLTWTHKGKEMSSHVVPDKGLFGVEFFLAHTYPDFKRVLDRFSADQQRDPEFQTQKFSLLRQAFQGAALSKWDYVVGKSYSTDELKKAPDAFLECIRDYLEAIAGFPNVGDQIIRWFQNMRKPALMEFEHFLQRRGILEDYLTEGLLRRTLALPTDREKAEQIFFAQPKEHQRKYAGIEAKVDLDMSKLQAFFDQCYSTDKANGTLDKIKRDKEAGQERAAQKESRKNRPREKTTRDRPVYDPRGKRGGRTYGDRRHDRRDRDDHRRREYSRDRHDGKEHRQRDPRDFKKRDNFKKRDGFKKREHEAMHVDKEETKSRSRSRSRSRERERSSSCSRRSNSDDSSARSEQNYFVDHEVDDASSITGSVKTADKS
ncbi:MAG: hypothetical protein ACO3QH_09570, partial [Ilumatobacteraceae bacterium]